MARAEMTNPGGLPDSGRIVVLWDPEIVEEDDYANLVAALGDLVRSKGGLGVERIGSQGITVPAAAEVLQ